MSKRTIEELESQVARLSGDLASARRGQKRYYERARLLENKIRNTIVVGERFDSDGLLALLRMVPKNPRKKWSWR